mgnify:CR=1 FL=1
MREAALEAAVVTGLMSDDCRLLISKRSSGGHGMDHFHFKERDPSRGAAGLARGGHFVRLGITGDEAIH